MYNTNQDTASRIDIKDVADNSCYTLFCSSSKNRIYLYIKGFWKNREAVPNFLKDIEKALLLVQPGFSILTDMQAMITHPQELNKLHEEAHRKMLRGGVSYVAHVVPHDKIARLQTNAIASTTGLPVHNFSSEKEAEEWLDKISTSAV